MKKITILTLILGLLFYIVPNSLAQQPFDITAFPARQEITLNPGETRSVPVAFYNRALNPTFGSLGVIDFIVKGNQNSPIFLEKTPVSTRYSASSWIQLPFTQVSLPAQDRTIIYLSVTAPKEALPGGHYASIYFETNPVGQPEGQRVTAVSQRINSLIYIKIPGDIKELAGITQFLSKKFREYGPIDVETHIVNNGYIHLQPKGKIVLKNLFGMSIQEQALDEKNIFPDAISIFTNSLGQKWMFGQYTVVLNATYGEHNKSLFASRTVFVFPWKITLVVLLATIILFLIGKNMYEKTLLKEAHLEEELEKEHEEIEKLKRELKKQ